MPLSAQVRLVLTGLTLVLLTIASVVPVSAARPPANDHINQATPITSVPFTTSAATPDAKAAKRDPESYCGPTAHSLWYTLTLPATTHLSIDTIGSDYDTVLAVYTGTPHTLTEQTCNDDIDYLNHVLASQISITVDAEVTYYILVGSFGAQPPGTLVLNVHPE